MCCAINLYEPNDHQKFNKKVKPIIQRCGGRESVLSMTYIFSLLGVFELSCVLLSGMLKKMNTTQTFLL